MRSLSSAVLFTGLALPLAALAQYEDPRPSRAAGVSVGIYLPTNSDVKDAFGNSLKFGFSVVEPRPRKRSYRFQDVGFISGSENGNKVFLIPAVYGLETRLGSVEDDRTVPYARLGIGAAYADYAVGRGPLRESQKTVLFTAIAEVGVIFGSKIKVSAAYNYFNRTNGLDFSGIELSATYAIAKF